MLQGANSFYAVLFPLAYGLYEVCPDFVLITPTANLSGVVGLGHGLRRDGYEEKIKLGRNQFQPRMPARQKHDTLMALSRLSGPFFLNAGTIPVCRRFPFVLTRFPNRAGTELHNVPSEVSSISASGLAVSVRRGL